MIQNKNFGPHFFIENSAVQRTKATQTFSLSSYGCSLVAKYTKMGCCLSYFYLTLCVRGAL